MLDRGEWRIVEFDPGPPIITVIIDTEAEFNWSGPFSRDLMGVENIRRLESAQQLFERFGIKPAYLVDYAVSSQREGYEPMRELLADGRSEIGAHLQPWETPPFEEETTESNSFLGNLAVDLQRRKLMRLTQMVEETFGTRPRVYKAGRYGVGPATADLLAELGYLIDLSVLPGTDLRDRHGPDFRHCPIRPYWFGRGGDLLEIPMTVGIAGVLAPIASSSYPYLASRGLRWLHLPGVMARLGLLERIALTPEGVNFAEMRRLTEALMRRGHRSFTLSYHSPSLMPGSTPYVRDAKELEAFMARIRAYLDFFFGELGGIAMTPMELRGLAASSKRVSTSQSARAKAT
jgi:hypothetical protein